MRAIYVDAEKREVREVELEHGHRRDVAGRGAHLRDLQRLVGGFITIALVLGNGDTLYVDDEGLLKSPENFFYIAATGQPFAGNGVLVGPATRGGYDSAALSTLDAVRAAVTFIDLAQVRRETLR